MGLSFPWPLPVSPEPSGGLCANSTHIDTHLCGPLEIEAYARFMLLTDDPNKIPDLWCEPADAACQPGFFDGSPWRRPAAPPSGPAPPSQPMACCPGYFCPAQLTCMLPCPLGAFCDRAWPAPAPDEYSSPPLDKPLYCAPYAYKMRELGCGGADKWRIVPGSAFPAAAWDAGSGSIFCSPGHFCPNTTTQLVCPAGHSCRQGEMEPQRCPIGARCPPGTEVPGGDYTGVTIDVLLFCVLLLGYAATSQYRRIMRTLSHKERLKITWGAGAPRIEVVRASEARRSPTPSRSRTPSRSHTHSPNGTAEPGDEASTTPPAAWSRVAGLLPRRRVAASNGGANAVWAAFRGPGGAGDAGCYEPLLEEGGLPGDAADAAGGGADAVELAHAGAAAHACADSADCHEDDLTPRGLHARLVAPHCQSLLSSPLRAVHTGAGGARGQPPLTVEFRSLRLRLRSYGGKTVLAGVSGTLPGGQLSAIMGPSGAGKSSLLNVLAGKSAAYAVHSGTITVNGQPLVLADVKPHLGFVPQADIVHATLTVQENLLFAARLRLPANSTRDRVLLAVERAIAVLRLDDVRDCRVGDDSKRGISGGQRKRTSVGLELVAEPRLLFLDEPTSGLDSTASKALARALSDVAGEGVTVAAVIHQPSWALCGLFHHLLLLGKGGRTVYCGTMPGVQAYFEGLGFGFAPHENPADAVMDIVAGERLHPGQASAAELFDAWSAHCGQPASEPGAVVAPEAEACEGGELLGDADVAGGWRQKVRHALLFTGAAVLTWAGEVWAGIKYSMPGPGQRWAARLFSRRGSRCAAHRQPGFAQQFGLCLNRAVLKASREPLATLGQYAILALTGCSLGLLSSRGHDNILHFAVSITYAVVALGLLATVGALATFSRDRLVFRREAASGLNLAAFFLALDAFDVVGTLLRSAVFMLAYVCFALPRAAVPQLLAVAGATAYCCTGLGYLLSLTLEPGAAQLAAAVLALVSTLVARQGHPGALLRAAQAFSFARWALEGLVVAESNRLAGVWLLARCADLSNLGYDVRRFGACLAALAALGAGFRALALAAMLALNQDRQQ